MKCKIMCVGLMVLCASNVFGDDLLRASKQDPYQVHIFPNGGMFVFYAKITSGTAPSCSGDNRWSIKTDKPGASALISMVIAAKSSARTISVVGTGKCNPAGYGYEVSYLYYN